jgi:hypothetical protein
MQRIIAQKGSYAQEISCIFRRIHISQLQAIATKTGFLCLSDQKRWGDGENRGVREWEMGGWGEITTVGAGLAMILMSFDDKMSIKTRPY